jgi:NDP-sugar pyrophosphorylase family protein
VLNIVLPMAGRGQRFLDAGYTLPKPLIPVQGKPMVQVVVENLRPARPCRFVFLILREHAAEFRLDARLQRLVPGSRVLYLDHVSEGPACTVLQAAVLIDNNDPLMIANCDQWIDADVNDYLAVMDATGADGLIMTMWADDPKWSYVRLDAGGAVAEAAEKKVISNEATVGIYNFARGRDFVWAANEMIRKDLRVNNEFYVAPAYNELIARGARVAVHNVGREYDGMHGLGTPADLQRFCLGNMGLRGPRRRANLPKRSSQRSRSGEGGEA